MGKLHTNMGKRRMRSLPKIMLHEHLDCSLRPRTMLELWESIGFEKAKIAFPADVLSIWRRANSESGPARRRSRAEASAAYQKFLVGFASQSLANYVNAIVDHVLPLMQTSANLTRITRERVEDAIADGITGMELRFAPQLHTWQGLSLEEVMDSVIAGTKISPFPLKLTLCALRHENGDMARKLADLCVKYKRHVGVFDLAADEKANPGLLKWWLKAALYVKVLAPKVLVTIHLWETDEPTDQDIALLRGFEVLLLEARTRAEASSAATPDEVWAVVDEVVEDLYPTMSAVNGDADTGELRIGHGFRGNRQGNRLLEICPTSNVVTGQVTSFGVHPIDRLHREGRRVTVNTDGTLFTEVQLSDEYRKLKEHFGWTPADFLKVNLTALEGSAFSQREKSRLRAVLKRAYMQGK
jgi:adenosine deaminase